MTGPCSYSGTGLLLHRQIVGGQRGQRFHTQRENALIQHEAGRVVAMRKKVIAWMEDTTDKEAAIIAHGRSEKR